MMAKRRRLILKPTASASPEMEPLQGPAATQLSSSRAGIRARQAPIADVAGGSAAHAALEEIAHEMGEAARDGRLLQRIKLDAIDQTYLVRDRSFVDEDEMVSLEQSLRARGQQTPIEVVALEAGRFGLISGWRRLIALQRLRAEAHDGAFTTALCVVRTPQTASDAYIAMVEENEIRSGLSFYERARIAARAAEEGAYPTARHAVRGLFANASASKRSKITSFLGLYDTLDGVLKFPEALSERMGLQLAKALEADAELVDKIKARLEKSPPSDSAAEQNMLTETLAKMLKSEASPQSASTPIQPESAESSYKKPVGKAGIHITRSRERLVLSGAGVTDALVEALEVWLAEHG